MKTRHVVAIGILTAIAVGLLAIAIKTTGHKPKVQQTNAYYEIENYDYNENDPEFEISGHPSIYNCTFYENAGVPITSIIEYDIGYERQEIIFTLKCTGFYYIDTQQNLYEVNLHYFETSWTNISYDQITIDQLDTIYIYQTAVLVQLDQNNTDTQIRFVWQIRNENIDHQLITQISSPYLRVSNKRLYIDDVDQYYLQDSIATKNIIDNLTEQYQTGYTTGYQTKGDLADGNFVSIQETMLNVLTMPFTFISQGFNVTLWENTPYAINIGNFIKSLIAIATILFIIKMFTSGFSVIGNYTTGTGNNISQWRKNRSERKLNESKARLNDRTNPNHKSRDSHVTIKKE